MSSSNYLQLTFLEKRKSFVDMTIQALPLTALVEYKNNTQESWNKNTKSNTKSNSPVKPAANLVLPPLPPLPPSTPPSKITTNNSTQPTMSRASLTRLEVESGSSKSLPISFPYYFLDQGDPEDTFNLWQRQEDSLTNISNRKDEHLPSQSPTPQVDTERIDSTKKLNNDEVFNPVPKRFSQFIIDQQNPYVSQRLDNLSTISPSMQSERYIMRSLTPLTGTNKKRAGLLVMNPEQQENNSKRTSDELIPPRREISDSMGSQATIFSTRQELHNVPLVNRNVKKSNTIFRRRNNKSKRTSNVRVQTSSSDASVLTRKNAIRSKQGSWLYRLKVRLQRMVAKFKFYSFKVSSRRSASIRRSKSTKLVRKHRENPQNRDMKRIQSIRVSSSRFNHISSPLTNPHLGKQPVFQVATIDDNLKFLAGAPKESVYMGNNRSESQGKLNHLSEYIQQQEQNYMQKMIDNKATSETSKLILPSPDFNDTRSELLTESVTTHVKTIDEPLSRQPPAPPPHLDNSFNNINMGSRNVSLAQQRDLQHQVHSHSQNEVRQYEIAELWNSYLKQVLFKRILLRQEINMFQNFMATLATSNNQPNTRHNIAESTVGTSSYNESSILAPLKSMRGEKSVVSSYCSHSSRCQSNYSSSDKQDTASVYTTGSSESNLETKEYNYEDEEFNKKVLNRRSMLGEMLEYLSEEDDENVEDDESVASLQKTYSIVSSGKHSDVLLKTYGTVIRRSNSKPSSPLKRSFGLNHSLSSIVS